ncbi:MAG: DUF6614 family protein [Pseudomonadota bacterium]
MTVTNTVQHSPAIPCSMLGTFNLRGNADLKSFRSAFDALCAHLRRKGHLQSWRLWQRAYHPGYDANFPETSIIIEMCFHNHDEALECWDYFETGGDTVNPLHRAVNSKVCDAHFVLCVQMP